MSCSNPDGTNAVMAALAVAAAQDLGRWQASKDFVVFKTSGRTEGEWGGADAIKLTSGSDAEGPIGKSRCSDGRCARVQALLDLQYDQAKNVYFQGSGSTKVLLNPAALRSRTVAKLQEQIAFDKNAKDGVSSAAPVERHKLNYLSAAKGGCDTNFTFHATKTDGTALRYVNQLYYKLAFADLSNPYISFTNLGNGNVSIDPTYGLDEDGTTTTGSCTAACTKISIATNYTGACCACGGVTKKFVKSAFNASIYQCQ